MGVIFESLGAVAKGSGTQPDIHRDDEKKLEKDEKIYGKRNAQ